MVKSKNKFHKTVFDPKLIVVQIVCMQCLFYLVMGLAMGLFHGSRINLKHLLTDRYLTMESATGLADLTANAICAIVG